jgi:hypothetical protein
MAWVRFELTIQMFERAETVHALDRTRPLWSAHTEYGERKDTKRKLNTKKAIYIIIALLLLLLYYYLNIVVILTSGRTMTNNNNNKYNSIQFVFINVQT